MEEGQFIWTFQTVVGITLVESNELRTLPLEKGEEDVPRAKLGVIRVAMFAYPCICLNHA